MFSTIALSSLLKSYIHIHGPPIPPINMLGSFHPCPGSLSIGWCDTPNALWFGVLFTLTEFGNWQFTCGQGVLLENVNDILSWHDRIYILHMIYKGCNSLIKFTRFGRNNLTLCDLMTWRSRWYTCSGINLQNEWIVRGLVNPFFNSL